MTISARFYRLSGYQSRDIVAFVVSPQAIDASVVKSAWSYALRHTSDALDVPNYERAVELMRQRHPSWVVYYPYNNVLDVGYSSRAPDDEPESPE